MDIFIATDSGDMTFVEFLDMVSTFSPKVHSHPYTIATCVRVWCSLVMKPLVVTVCLSYIA